MFLQVTPQLKKQFESATYFFISDGTITQQILGELEKQLKPFILVIPKEIDTLGSECFTWLKFETVRLSAKIKSIGHHCFSFCSKLSQFDFVESLLELGDSCFFNCNFLELNLPNTILKIEKNCFHRNLNLMRITLPENLTEIPGYLFYECGKLEKIFIPPKVTSMGFSSFFRCRSLNELRLPSSVLEFTRNKSGESFCFCECDALFSSSGKIIIEEGSVFSESDLRKIFDEKYH